MEKFTGLQMKCLLLWTGLPEKNRTLTSVAIKMDASRTAARNALNAAVEQGVLDKSYKVTESGEEKIKAWRNQRRLLLNWMKMHHVNETEWDDVYTLMTEMGQDFKRAMLQESLLCSICRNTMEKGEHRFRGIDLADYLSAGKYEVRVEFRKLENEGHLSMADRAFERPVYMIVGEKESQIVLKRLKILQFSPIKRQEVGGMMRSLQYYVDGKAKTVRAEGGVVRVPTSDIEWSCSEEDGSLTGRLEMGFTCTAGFHQKDHNRAVMNVNILGDCG